MNIVQALIAQNLTIGQKTLSEYDSKLILAQYGIPITNESLVTNLSEAETAAVQIGYPVVLKVCASEAVHKTEQGLIELGIADSTGLKHAFECKSDRFQAHHTHC